MTSAATGHPAHFIEWQMPLAEALQYQALWLEQQGNTTALVDASPLQESRL